MADGPYRVVVLVSGSGTNLQSLIDSVHQPGGDIEIVRVISSRRDAYALTRAAEAGIPTETVIQSHYPTRAERDHALAEVVKRAAPDLIVLAGWMSILTDDFLTVFPNRVINLHPSLLPAFPGMHAIDEALAWGVRWTGVSVHFVEQQVDAGPPILQVPVEVFSHDDADTLRARIQQVEHRIVPEAVRLFAAGRVVREPAQSRRIVIREKEAT